MVAIEFDFSYFHPKQNVKLKLESVTIKDGGPPALQCEEIVLASLVRFELMESLAIIIQNQLLNAKNYWCLTLQKNSNFFLP